MSATVSRAAPTSAARDHRRASAAVAATGIRSDAAFVAVLEQVFSSMSAQVVTFPNPYTETVSSNTVYLGLADGPSDGPQEDPATRG